MKPFDRQKAIETIKYIASTAPNPDIYWIGKILYFADQLHLQRYGRLICGDDYAAMQYGPVPSGTYDLLRTARMFGNMPDLHPAIGEFEIQGKNKVVALRKPDLTVFSDSDIACIKESIERYGSLTFPQLKKISHDKAFDSADPNGFIDIEQIVSMMPNAKSLLEHIRDCSAV